MPRKTRFSKAGLPNGSAVDVAALSDLAAMRQLDFVALVGSQPLASNSAYFVINASTDHYLGTVLNAGTVVKASVRSGRAASLGAGSYSLYKSTDGSSKTLITNTIDPETITAHVPSNFTMVTTSSANVLAAGDQLWLRCTADNNAIATDASGVRVHVGFVPTDTTPTREGTWGS